jgi:hypothetical protein
MRKIFYSWQSDTSGNRSYLEDCLNDAVARIPDFAVDAATRNSRGAVDIAQTILLKIDEAEMVLADVSIINPESEGRKTPNPNVLYELGYAVGKKGEGPVILVVNNATTDISDLPFDIRNRRVIAKRFDNRNKAALTDELFEIISSHAPAGAEQDGPYIYLELNAHGSEGMTFRAYNDEDDIYQIEAIEIDGVEEDVSLSLPGRSNTPNIHVSKVPRPPYSQPLDKITFVVSRRNKSFRIRQRLILESRADERFNLVRLDPDPVSIEEIPRRRPKPAAQHLDSTGDSYRLQIEDVETH